MPSLNKQFTSLLVLCSINMKNITKVQFDIFIMYSEDLDQKINEYEYKSETYRQHLYDTINTTNTLQQYQNKALQLTSQLNDEIRNIIIQQQKHQVDTQQILWGNPQPIDKVPYRPFKNTPVNNHNFEQKIQNKKVKLILKFLSAKHIKYGSGSIYDSNLVTNIPNKFKFIIYIFGQQVSTQYLTIVQNQVYSWFQHHYFKQKKRFVFQYQIDIGSLKIPMPEKTFLQSRADFVCQRQDGFVFGKGQCKVCQLISEYSSEYTLDVRDNNRQYLFLSIQTYTTFQQSLLDSQSSDPLSIDVFWNHAMLVPILLSNSTNYSKKYTLQFQCKYSSPTFVTTSQVFDEYNLVQTYKFEQPKMISQNQLQISPGGELVIFILLFFQKNNKQVQERFLLHTMGITYTINASDYLKYEPVELKNLNNIPNYCYLSYKGKSFYHSSQPVKAVSLSGICGQYFKLDKSIVNIFPENTKTKYQNGSTFICCYSNTMVLYKSEAKIIFICNIDVVAVQGVHTIRVRRKNQPQRLDISSCVQFNTNYQIISSSQRIKVLSSVLFFSEEQKETRYLWVQIEALENAEYIFFTNLDNLKGFSVLIEYENQQQKSDKL